MPSLAKRVAAMEGQGLGVRLPALWVVPRKGEQDETAIARARNEQGIHDPEQMQIMWRVKNAA